MLPAPALVADSLTATSLSLEWQIPPKLVEFTKSWSHIASYLVQWRYEEIGHDWKYCRNQSIYENSTIQVNDLRPFTKYSVSCTCDNADTVLQNMRIFAVPDRLDIFNQSWYGTLLWAESGYKYASARSAAIRANNCKSCCCWSHKDIIIMGIRTVSKRSDFVLCAPNHGIELQWLPCTQGWHEDLYIWIWV